MNVTLRRALLILPALVAAYPPPEPCTGWCSQDLRDPNVVVRGKTYYRFATGSNFSTSTAPSISGPWTRVGSALQGGTVIVMPSKQKPKNDDDAHRNRKVSHADDGPGLWAPDILLVNDTYYMTYTVTRGGRPNEIGVATSKTLEPGSWTDHGGIKCPPSEDYNRIDSNLFQSAPGDVPLLAFGSYLKAIYQVPMNFPPLTIDKDAPRTNIAFNKSSDAMEAAYQFQWNVDGLRWYYLFFSSGRCCNQLPNLEPPGGEYKIMVCRSEQATGPFYDQNGRYCIENGGTMILGSHDDVYAPGGQGVVWDEQLQSPMIYYHYLNKTVSYDNEEVFFGWNYLDFDSGWPVLVRFNELPSIAAAQHHGLPNVHPNSAAQRSFVTASSLIGLLVAEMAVFLWA